MFKGFGSICYDSGFVYFVEKELEMILRVLTVCVVCMNCIMIFEGFDSLGWNLCIFFSVKENDDITDSFLR